MLREKEVKKTAALCLVSAWVAEHCLSLGQSKVAKKSNEKTAIPDLIAHLDISGALVSIDATGTHIPFAQQIRDQQAHYLMALKQNQKGLHEEVRDWINSRKHQLEQDLQTDYVGGRLEKRTTYVCHQLTFLDELKQWPDCQSVIMVECERSFKNEPDKINLQTRFYISSKLESAAYFGTCTRNHWSIENQLHW